MVRQLMLALILAASLVNLVQTRAGAAPQTCTQTSAHCYAEQRVGPTSGGSGFHGAYGYIHAACLYNSNNGSYFSTTETWLGFSGGYWIEAGIATGDPQGARRYFFWADQRPGGGYHEHDNTAPNVDPNTSYQFAIVYVGSSNFSVSVGSSTGGTSTAWGSHTTANDITTGTETNGGTASIYASSSGLGYVTLQGATHAGWTWGGGGSYPIRDPSNWGFVQQVSANSWYRYGTVTTGC